MSSTFELDLWRRAETLFEAALDRPQSERREFLDRVCGQNHALKEAVSSLLERDDEDSPFLETPYFEPQVRFADAVSGGEDGVGEHPWSGRVLGAYRLLRPIGSGGMSHVFLGERVDQDVEQKVAIKILREEARHGAELRSIRKERRILTRLDHPHIARSLDGGTTEEGLPYVVLEFLDGEPLTEYCDATRLDIAKRLGLFRKICQAVDFAHRHLIVHRDLKPSNILVTSEGAPKLLDFGIAKLLHDRWDGAGVDLTRTRSRFLTPAYASPEQLAGKPVSIASDIYSLGVVLYELLTGMRPQPSRAGIDTGIDGFQRPSRIAVRTESGDGGTETPEQRARHRALTPEQLRRRLSGDLDSIVLHCLQGSPEERYRSVGELDRDLQRHLEGLPVIARPPKLSYRLKKFAQRHRLGVALGGLAAAALTASGLGLVAQNRQVIEERDRAELARGRAEEARTEAEQVTRFLTEAFLLADPHHSAGEMQPGADVTAHQVLDYSAQRIRDELSDQPILKARLMHTIGSVFSRLSREKEAEALEKEALEIRRRLSKERPAEIVASVNSLVFLYVNSARLEEAEPLAEEALRLSEPLGDPLLFAESLANAGVLTLYQGDLEKAEGRLRRALEIQDELLPPGHRSTILTRTHLGGLLSRRGESEEAEALLRLALEESIEVEGENHVRVASVAQELGWLLLMRGEGEEAGILFRRSFQILRDQLGMEHRSTVEAHASLATLKRELGDYAGAVAMLRENLEMRLSALPDDYVGIVTTLNNLGLLAYDQGYLEEAESWFRRTLQTALDHHGEQDRDRHTYLRNLGLSLHGQGHYEEAEPWLREAVALLEAEQGKRSPRYANGLTSLSGTLSALGRSEEALELSLEAEEVLEAALPAGHPRIVRARNARGASLVGLGRFEEAEALLLETYGALKEAPPQVRRTATERLCTLYRTWKRRQDAEAYCASRDGGSS